MLTLTIAHRRELKAQAHALNPVVMIGKTGLSSSVIEELNRGLASHGLIKIRAQIDNRVARNELFVEICQLLDAVPVQHIGKIFVIYRPKPEEIDKQEKHLSEKKTKASLRIKRNFQR